MTGACSPEPEATTRPIESTATMKGTVFARKESAISPTASTSARSRASSAAIRQFRALDIRSPYRSFHSCFAAIHGLNEDCLDSELLSIFSVAALPITHLHRPFLVVETQTDLSFSLPMSATKARRRCMVVSTIREIYPSQILGNSSKSRAPSLRKGLG